MKYVAIIILTASLLCNPVLLNAQASDTLEKTKIILNDLFHKKGSSKFFLPKKTKAIYLVDDSSSNGKYLQDELKFIDRNINQSHLKLFYDTINFSKLTKKIKLRRPKLSYSKREFEFTFSRYFIYDNWMYQTVYVKKGSCKYPFFCYIFKYNKVTLKLVKWYCNTIIIDG
ncbi:MAG: hypothetical protein RL708_1095 [Bacteroidota bacterium]|jgi:hypothetical protein